MADGDVSMHSLGKPGEPCEQCGSPLAADQRYCLNCGKRRGAPRVDYRQQMLGGAAEAGSEQPQSAAAATEPEPAKGKGEGKAEPKGERDFAPLAAVGGIAVLGLMLLVGVLIGKGDSGDTVAAPAPVVRVGGTAGTEANTAEAGAGASAGGAKNTGIGGSSANKKNAKSGSKEATSTGDAVEASTDELEELEGESGEEAAKNALKLPDKIATPGAPPPIDKSKPPGGGEGGGLVIK
jgi:hypothetical protein